MLCLVQVEMLLQVKVREKFIPKFWGQKNKAAARKNLTSYSICHDKGDTKLKLFKYDTTFTIEINFSNVT